MHRIHPRFPQTPVLAVMLAAAVAISGLSTTLAAGPGNASSKKVTLNMWTIWGNDPGKKEWIDSVTQAYMKAHPNVTIKIRYFSDGAKGQLYQNLRTLFQSGGQGAPDIYTIDDRPIDHIPWQQAGWAANMKGKLDLSHFTPSFMQPLEYDNGVWGVPVEAFADLVYYNKGLFDKWGITVPPSGKLSWQQFQEVVKKAKAAGIYPMTVGAQNLSVIAEWWPFSMLMRKLGGAELAGLSTGQTKWTDPTIVKGLQFVKTTLGWFPSNVASTTTGEGYTELFTGKAAMENQGPWLIATAAASPQNGGAPKGFKLGVMQVPLVPNGKGNNDIEVGTGSGWAVSSFSKHQKTAIDFLNFASTPEWGLKWMQWSKEPTGIKVDLKSAMAKLPPILRSQLQWIDSNHNVTPAFYQRFTGQENDAVERDFSHMYSPDYTVQQMVKDLARYQK